jgi:twinkle protein
MAVSKDLEKMMRWSELGINVPYGKTGEKVKIFCPKCREYRHDKHDKSLSCDMATGLFKCHYCGYSGSAAPKQENLYAPFVNPRPLSGKRPVYKKPKPPPGNVQQISAKTLNWFKGCGISEDALKALEVTEGPEYMPQKNGEANTVQFNY